MTTCQRHQISFQEVQKQETRGFVKGTTWVFDDGNDSSSSAGTSQVMSQSGSHNNNQYANGSGSGTHVSGSGGGGRPLHQSVDDFLDGFENDTSTLKSTSVSNNGVMFSHAEEDSHCGTNNGSGSPTQYLQNQQLFGTSSNISNNISNSNISAEDNSLQQLHPQFMAASNLRPITQYPDHSVSDNYLDEIDMSMSTSHDSPIASTNAFQTASRGDTTAPFMPGTGLVSSNSLENIVLDISEIPFETSDAANSDASNINYTGNVHGATSSVVPVPSAHLMTSVTTSPPSSYL